MKRELIVALTLVSIGADASALEVDPAMVEGNWVCRTLVPEPDMPPIVMQMSFDGDGTFNSKMVMPMAGMMEGMTDLLMTMSGTWSVSSDLIEVATLEREVSPADGGELTGQAAQIVAMMGPRMSAMGPVDGDARVLEINATSLVVRPEEPNAETIDCSR